MTITTGPARANNHQFEIFMMTGAQELDARADEILARLQAFDAEISALVAPLSDKLKADLARRYRELHIEVEMVNLLRAFRN